MRTLDELMLNEFMLFLLVLKHAVETAGETAGETRGAGGIGRGTAAKMPLH